MVDQEVAGSKIAVHHDPIAPWRRVQFEPAQHEFEDRRDIAHRIEDPAQRSDLVLLAQPADEGLRVDPVDRSDGLAATPCETGAHPGESFVSQQRPGQRLPRHARTDHPRRSEGLIDAVPAGHNLGHRDPRRSGCPQQVGLLGDRCGDRRVLLPGRRTARGRTARGRAGGRTSLQDQRSIGVEGPGLATRPRREANQVVDLRSEGRFERFGHGLSERRWPLWFRWTLWFIRHGAGPTHRRCLPRSLRECPPS